MHATQNPVSPAPVEPTPADVEAVVPQIIAVWADDDDPAHAELFTPDGYADWYEANNLSGAFPDPARFYAAVPTGCLGSLDHAVRSSGYDEDDYAIVTHTWTWWTTGDLHAMTVYAVGVARRDGRA